jgi:hypothetical protein
MQSLIVCSFLQSLQMGLALLLLLLLIPATVVMASPASEEWASIEKAAAARRALLKTEVGGDELFVHLQAIKERAEAAEPMPVVDVADVRVTGQLSPHVLRGTMAGDEPVVLRQLTGHQPSDSLLDAYYVASGLQGVIQPMGVLSAEPQWNGAPPARPTQRYPSAWLVLPHQALSLHALVFDSGTPALRRPPPSLSELVAVLTGAATGLASLHGAGLVVRHISAQTVLIDANHTALLTDRKNGTPRLPSSPHTHCAHPRPLCLSVQCARLV